MMNMKINWKDLVISVVGGSILSIVFMYLYLNFQMFGPSHIQFFVWLTMIIPLVYYFHRNNSDSESTIVVSLIYGFLLFLIIPLSTLLWSFHQSYIAALDLDSSEGKIIILGSEQHSDRVISVAINTILSSCVFYLISSIVIALIIWFLTNKFIHKNGDVK